MYVIAIVSKHDYVDDSRRVILYEFESSLNMICNLGTAVLVGKGWAKVGQK